MRGVVSGPSGSGRGPNLKAPPPRRGILKKSSQPTNPGLKKSPVASDNRPTFASRPVVVDPYADEVDPYGRGFSSPSEDGAPSPDERLKAIVRDVELLGSPPRREARRRAEKPRSSGRTTFDGTTLPPTKRPPSAEKRRRKKTPVKARPGTPAAVGTKSRRTPPPGPAGPAPVFSGAIASGLRRQKRRSIKSGDFDPLAQTYSAPRPSQRRPTSAPAPRRRRRAPAASGGLFPATLLAGFNDLMIRGATDDPGAGPGPTCTARTRRRRRTCLASGGRGRRRMFCSFGSLVKWML